MANLLQQVDLDEVQEAFDQAAELTSSWEVAATSKGWYVLGDDGKLRFYEWEFIDG